MVRNRSIGRPKKRVVMDESPATLERLEEAYAAIRERRFRPWHAGDLLAVAHSKFERAAAVAKIVELVGGGYEGRGLVVRLEPSRGRPRAGRARHGKRTRAAV